jgi:hypothetical protein
MMADKGYYNGKDLAKCKLHEIIAIVPKQDPPRINGEDGYTGNDFKYDEEANTYTCPTGNISTCKNKATIKNPEYTNREACRKCENIDKCTKAKRGYRRIVHKDYFEVRYEVD